MSKRVRGQDIIDSDYPLWTPVLYTTGGADGTVRCHVPFDGFIMKVRVTIITPENNTTTVINVGVPGALTRNINGLSIEDMTARTAFDLDISAIASKLVKRGDILTITKDAGTPAAGESAISLQLGYAADLDDFS